MKKAGKRASEQDNARGVRQVDIRVSPGEHRLYKLTAPYRDEFVETMLSI